MSQYQYTITPEPAPGGPRPKSGLAIASLVLGILGFCTGGVLGLVGLILGIVALNRTGPPDSPQPSKGLAIAGVSVSAAGMLIGCVAAMLIGLLLPALGKARETAQHKMALVSMQQLYAGFATYAADHNDKLPPSDDWIEALRPYAPAIDQFTEYPGSDKGDMRAFIMNENLDGVQLSSIQFPDRAPLLFEVEYGNPSAGGPDLLPREPRHRAGFLILFADGHIENVPPDAVGSLLWEP